MTSHLNYQVIELQKISHTLGGGTQVPSEISDFQAGTISIRLL